MERLTGEDAGQRVPIKTIVTASFVGALMEWYDFFLYGTAAALVFNSLFFPEFEPLTGTIAAFATFGAGFFTRPLGGFVFGHYGDRIGRKAMLIVTLGIMGVSTFLIGLLPTYGSIGIWAPILLVTLRLLQGFGIGGEYGGATLMTTEHAPRETRGFWGSLPQAGLLAGLLLATGVFGVVSRLPEEQFLSWGWRVPFLVSIILLGVGLFVRSRIMETPAFQQIKDTGTEAAMPIVELLRRYPKNVLLTLGARLSESVTATMVNTFVLAYLVTQLELSRTVAVTSVMIAAGVSVVTIPIYGALSDRVGRRPIYMAGAAFVALFSFPFFLLLNTKVIVLIWLALILMFAFGSNMMFAVQAVFFAELFGTRVRYSALSVAYQVSALLGGLTPLTASFLLSWSGGEPWLVAAALLTIALLSLISSYLTTETFRRDVSEAESSTLEAPPVGHGRLEGRPSQR